MELCGLNTYNACAEGQMPFWGWKSQVARPRGKPELAYVFSDLCQIAGGPEIPLTHMG